MKKELIEKITSRCLGKIAKEHIKQILSEELPDFQRIDEERFKRIYASKVCDIGLHIKEYNSTLPPALVRLPKATPYEFVDLFNESHSPRKIWEWLLSHYGTPEPKPLPKEMPKDLTRFAMGHDVYEVWDKIISEYGTPEPKPSLPTVEELAKEIESHGTKIFSFSVESIAKNLHDKYALPTHQWWQDLKEGDKFMYEGKDLTSDGKLYLFASGQGICEVEDCTPYTTPSAQEIIATHNLSEEEVKILREGKG